ncbi:hypothetical protein [Microvirga alba]|uniref:Uncharacterized protein n=1 Tax=Microvirga alba TaxID=2791025 RepID=A0A931FQG4_9HYPH|nr:hypothetical protein [Microvirga alba]MBF9234607.1 hypothetical protein [Microvirga alba]
MVRLDLIKSGRISGLMLVRDWDDGTAGLPIPWVTQAGDLSYMAHEAKRLIRLAGLRDELSLTSFRHGGMTEMGDADLTDSARSPVIRRRRPADLRQTDTKADHRRHQKGRSVRTNRGDLSE